MDFYKEYRVCYQILFVFGYFPIVFDGHKFNTNQFTLLYTIFICILTTSLGLYFTYELFTRKVLINLGEISTLSDNINTILAFVCNMLNIFISIVNRRSHARLLNQLSSIDMKLLEFISIKKIQHNRLLINKFLILCVINFIGYLFGIFTWTHKIHLSTIIFTILHAIVMVTQLLYVLYIQSLASNLNHTFCKLISSFEIKFSAENYLSIQNYEQCFYKTFKLFLQLSEIKLEFSIVFGFHFFLNVLHNLRFITLSLFATIIMLTNYSKLNHISMGIYFICVYCIPQCIKECYLISTMDSIGQKV